jgi:hypothetical protein
MDNYSFIPVSGYVGMDLSVLLCQGSIMLLITILIHDMENVQRYWEIIARVDKQKSDTLMKTKTMHTCIMLTLFGI